MRVAVTGAGGFLGWHVRTRLSALTDHEVVPLGRADWGRLPHLLEGVDAVLHLAGLNRASDQDLENDNRALAMDIVEAADTVGIRPRIAYANSIQADGESPYGRGKASAAEVLRRATDRWGSPLVDIVLPHLFGEHARPGYNSFVATFVDKVVKHETPMIDDRPIALLHAQKGAQLFIDALAAPTDQWRPEGTPTSVQNVWDRLVRYEGIYTNGRIPDLEDGFDVELFNTYRAALFPERCPLSLTLRSDERGWLVETAQWCGGEGQTFVSITRPGATRGEHYHLRKVERFIVLAGQARISLRQVGSNIVHDFDVTGERPVAIDMPTGWIHNLTNTGTTEVITQFWVNELFNPDDPDTFWEPVRPKEHA